MEQAELVMKFSTMLGVPLKYREAGGFHREIL